MDIVQLKSNIEDKNISNSPLIFKYADNKFLVYQYAYEIAKIRGLKVCEISSIYDVSRDELLFDSMPEFLYICDVENFTEDITDADTDIIVICSKLADNLKIDFIDFPKLIDWQIEDYVKVRIPGLNDMQIKWLCDISKHDIYRLDNECKKFEIFTCAEQPIIFDLINSDNGFSDMNSLTIFNFTNAVLKHDVNTIHAVLKDLKSIDIEGSGLITIFSKQLRNIIDIQLNAKATAASLNMSPKQFNAIKYNCGYYNQNQLIKMYEFITNLDLRLKSGDFQFSSNTRENNNKFVEYITLNMLSIANK